MIMLLVYAKSLAVKFVIRNGQEYPKDGTFSDEQLAAQDWEPNQTSPPSGEPVPMKDCGCGESSLPQPGDPFPSRGVSLEGDQEASSHSPM